MPIRNIDFCFWNECNNHCLMCSNPNDSWRLAKYDYNNLVSRLKDIKEGIGSITVTGGEPTINPDFTRVFDFMKNKLPEARVSLLTNGRRFYYADFTKKCCELKHLSFVITLHGYNEHTHDEITLVKGSFKQTCRGLDNILKFKKPGQALEIRVVITKINLSFYTKILSFIKENYPGADRIVLLFLEIEGAAQENISKVGLTYSKLGKSLPGLSSIIPAFREFRLYHFPLCVINKVFWKYVWATLPEQEIIFPSACKKCIYRTSCPGVHKGYIDNYGDREFRPFLKKVA